MVAFYSDNFLKFEIKRYYNPLYICFNNIFLNICRQIHNIIHIQKFTMISFEMNSKRISQRGYFLITQQRSKILF